MAQPNWNSGLINNTGLQTQLKNYMTEREQFNDSSLPAFIELITGVFTALNSLQNQINTGSAVVNIHTHQTSPPAHYPSS